MVALKPFNHPTLRSARNPSQPHSQRCQSQRYCQRRETYLSYEPTILRRHSRHSEKNCSKASVMTNPIVMKKWFAPQAIAIFSYAILCSAYLVVVSYSSLPHWDGWEIQIDRKSVV